ncbi:hypothetical protein [Nonomuraea roseola]|uniref:Uncharacterized protein n=1 Tax=Nonomuraea roseola TaxID=46179 RepID=A0ABV5QF97_9ACTN
MASPPEVPDRVSLPFCPDVRDQEQVARTMETTVQLAEALSLAGLGSAGALVVRVAVTVTWPSDSSDSGTLKSLPPRLPLMAVPLFRSRTT